MPVADNAPRNQYVATSGQTAFTYSFEILAQTDLVVLQEGVTLALTTDYTVSGVGDANGGTVTLVSGATADDEIVIYRDMAVERTTDYAAGGQLDPDTLDLDLDRILLGNQQLERDIGRALRLAPDDVFDDPVTEFVLPDSQTRAGKFLAFTAAGAPTVSDGTGVDSSLRDDLASTDAGKGLALVGLPGGQALFGYSLSIAFGPSQTPIMQVVRVHAADGALLGLASFNNPAAGGRLRIANSRGATAGSYTVLQSGDSLGSITFLGSDGVDFAAGAGIFCEADGTPGSDDMPGRLRLMTTADGASTLTERLRADSKGNVIVNTAAIATNATDGFLYVPTCAGTPTGTPSTYAGRAPIIVDTTNHKIYFYSGGAWRDAGP